MALPKHLIIAVLFGTFLITNGFAQGEQPVQTSEIIETVNGKDYYLHFVKTGETLFAIARAYGVEGIRIETAAEFKPALEKAIAINKPVVLDVPMINNPVPTTGHWNILDIYSPGKKVSHVSTG